MACRAPQECGDAVPVGAGIRAGGRDLHAVDDGGVETCMIATIIGRHVDLPVLSVAPQDVMDQFGWNPIEAGLVDDLDAGHYFATADA